MEIEEALIESGGELTPEIDERLGAMLELEEDKINGYLKFRAHLTMLEEGAKIESDRLAKKKRSAENARKRLESRLCEHMQARGVDVFETTLGKLRVMEASTQPCTLNADIDPKNLPEQFKKVTVAPDMTALKKAIQEGDEDAMFFASLGEKSKYLRVW